MLPQLFTARRIMLFIGLFLFAYTCFRAYIISITYDEAYSYLEFVLNPDWFSPVANYMGANNHLLNTWLMKICDNLLGMSEFSLRLPNICAHILYLLFSAKICNALFEGKTILLAFIIINVNPFLLDFFSLARGYGLSMGLMMPALFYLYKYINHNKIIYSLASIVFSSLTITANLSLIYFYFLLCMLIIIIPFYKRTFTIKLIVPIAAYCIFLSFIIPYLFSLDAAGAFFYGGNSDVFTETINSLVNSTLYFDGDFYPAISFAFSVFVVLILIVATFFSIKNLIQKNQTDKDLFFQSITFITIGILAGCTLQHILLNTKLPFDRTALYFIPLISLIVVYVFTQIRNGYVRKLLIIATAAGSILCYAHAFNFSHAIAWKTNGVAKTIFNILSKKSIKKSLPLSIGIDFMFEPCFAYYKMLNKSDDVNYAFCLNLNKTNQYFVVTSLSKQNRYLTNFKTSVIKDFNEYGVILYENKNHNSIPLEIAVLRDDFETYSKETARNISDKISRSRKQSTSCDTLDNYSRGLEIVMNDTILNANAFYFTSYFSSANFTNNNCLIVFSFENKTDGVYYWFPINVKVFGTILEWNKASYLMAFPEKIKKGDVLKIYFWNGYPEKVYVDDMTIKFLKY